MAPEVTVVLGNAMVSGATTLEPLSKSVSVTVIVSAFCGTTRDLVGHLTVKVALPVAGEDELLPPPHPAATTVASTNKIICLFNIVFFPLANCYSR